MKNEYNLKGLVVLRFQVYVVCRVSGGLMRKGVVRASKGLGRGNNLSRLQLLLFLVVLQFVSHKRDSVDEGACSSIYFGISLD